MEMRPKIIKIWTNYLEKIILLGGGGMYVNWPPPFKVDWAVRTYTKAGLLDSPHIFDGVIT
jgi:hypothetical protein